MSRKLSDYTKIEKATGTKLIFHRSAGNHCFARIYHKDKLDDRGYPTFTDFGLITPDMEFQITDEDAYFYFPKEDHLEPFIDMSPETMGLK